MFQMNEPKYKWDDKLMQYYELSMNPSAIYLLKQYPKLIYPYYLSSNPCAIDLIQEYLHTLNLDDVSKNPCAVRLLEKRPELIKWRNIVKNKNAVHIIEENLNKLEYVIDLGINENALDIIDFNETTWFQLTLNPKIEHEYDGEYYILRYKKKIVKTVRIHPTIFMAHISQCPTAMHIIHNYMNDINWYLLSCNSNAIHLLEKNIDKINWYNLCANPNAISIIEQNLDKLNNLCWIRLSSNPNALHLICKYDYELMKTNFKLFNQELIEYVMKPSRLSRLSSTYNIPFIELVDIYG
jgi:hypothetical protein